MNKVLNNYTYNKVKNKGKIIEANNSRLREGKHILANHLLFESRAKGSVLKFVIHNRNGKLPPKEFREIRSTLLWN